MTNNLGIDDGIRHYSNSVICNHFLKSSYPMVTILYCTRRVFTITRRAPSQALIFIEWLEVNPVQPSIKRRIKNAHIETSSSTQPSSLFCDFANHGNVAAHSP